MQTKQSPDEQPEPQEFTTAEEAWQAIADADRAGVFGVTTQNPSTIPVRKRGVRARAWLTNAVVYAQERGWPDKPMMPRREVLEDIGELTRTDPEAFRGVCIGLEAVVFGRVPPTDGDSARCARELALLDTERGATA